MIRSRVGDRDMVMVMVVMGTEDIQAMVTETKRIANLNSLSILSTRLFIVFI